MLGKKDSPGVPEVSEPFNVKGEKELHAEADNRRALALREAAQRWTTPSTSSSFFKIGAKSKTITDLIRAALTIEDNKLFVETLSNILSSEFAQNSKGSRLMVQELSKKVGVCLYEKNYPRQDLEALLAKPEGAALRHALSNANMIEINDGKVTLSRENFTPVGIAALMESKPELVSHLNLLVRAEDQHQKELKTGILKEPKKETQLDMPPIERFDPNQPPPGYGGPPPGLGGRR